MDKQGMIGVTVLWIIVAFSIMAVAILTMARSDQKLGAWHENQVKATYLAQAGALLERNLNFEHAQGRHTFESGTVETTVLKNGKDKVRLLCDVALGLDRKEIEIGWERSAENWKATYWKEIN